MTITVDTTTIQSLKSKRCDYCNSEKVFNPVARRGIAKIRNLCGKCCNTIQQQTSELTAEELFLLKNTLINGL